MNQIDFIQRVRFLDAPTCQKCHCAMSLRDGCEWPEDLSLCICLDCAIEEILRLRGFQAEQWKWVERTFPDERPGDVFDHLAEEIEELAENIYDPEEMADCFLLLQCLASHAGVDLLAAAREKFEKCKGRTWKKTERGFRHA